MRSVKTTNWKYIASMKQWMRERQIWVNGSLIISEREWQTVKPRRSLPQLEAFHLGKVEPS